jgi:hypothetical protein
MGHNPKFNFWQAIGHRRTPLSRDLEKAHGCRRQGIEPATGPADCVANEQSVWSGQAAPNASITGAGVPDPPRLRSGLTPEQNAAVELACEPGRRIRREWEQDAGLPPGSASPLAVFVAQAALERIVASTPHALATPCHEGAHEDRGDEARRTKRAQLRGPLLRAAMRATKRRTQASALASRAALRTRSRRRPSFTRRRTPGCGGRPGARRPQRAARAGPDADGPAGKPEPSSPGRGRAA